jgi:hypothetical protein
LLAILSVADECHSWRRRDGWLFGLFAMPVSVAFLAGHSASAACAGDAAPEIR